MPNHEILAMMVVRDFTVSSDWYARLLGRAPDRRPYPSCAEWQIAPCTRLQVLSGGMHAGRDGRLGPASVAILVDNLNEILRGLEDRHIDAPPAQPATHFVRVVPVRDPDGNTVTFMESAAA